MRRALIMAALAVAGCGDPLVKGTFEPTYFTINATLNSKIEPLPDNIQVALMWWNAIGPGFAYATELLSLSSTKALRYTLELHLQPQPSAVFDVSSGLIPAGVDPKMRFAQAMLVAYADMNGDHKLDISDDGSPSPDKVLGATESVTIFDLVSGAPAPARFAGIVPIVDGFSMVNMAPMADPDFGACDAFTPKGHLSWPCQQTSHVLNTPLPATSTVELEIKDDPRLQRYTCGSFWGPSEFPDWDKVPASEICDSPSCPFCSGYTCSLDLPPPGVTVDCKPDGTAYRYKICSDDPARCGTTFCHYGHGERQLGDPIPAGWPCPTP
jgi:hypothetical protein